MQAAQTNRGINSILSILLILWISLPAHLSPSGWGNSSNPNRAEAGQARPGAATTSPNDPEFPRQWGLARVHAQQAWDLNSGDASVWVALIDGGVERSNSAELGGKVLVDSGWDFVHQNATSDAPGPDLARGTAVAGIIAANTNNAQGIAGVGPNTKIVPLVANDETTLAQAIRYAAGIAAIKVIQVSAGLRLSDLGADPQTALADLQAALDEAFSKGKLVVAAAGDDGTDRQPSYPAALAHVLAVSATGPTDELWENRGCGGIPYGAVQGCGSNFGSSIDLAAPGSGIAAWQRICSLVVFCENRYILFDGSAYAASFVSGAAALVFSALPPEFRTPERVERILESTAQDTGDPGKDNQSGYGLLDMGRALQLASHPAMLTASLDLLGNHASHQDGVTYSVRVRAPGTNQLLFEQAGLTYALGHGIDVHLYGLVDGSYDVIIKGSNTLSKKISNVALTAGQITFLPAGALTISDYNGDDMVNSMDLEELSSRYNTTQWGLDINGDGLIDFLDLLAFIPDYNTSGDDYANTIGATAVVAPDLASALPAAGSGMPVGQALGATTRLSFAPDVLTVAQGDSFDLNAILDTGGKDILGLDIVLRYDPYSLEYVDTLSGDTNLNSFSLDFPEKGQIKVSSTIQSVLPAFNGVGNLFHLRWKALAGDGQSCVWIYFLPGSTFESNTVVAGSGLDGLQSAGHACIALVGGTARPSLVGSLAPAAGGFMNGVSNHVSATFDALSEVMVDHVGFEVQYDGAWHAIAADRNAWDGWGVDWWSQGVAQQVLGLRADVYDINGGVTLLEAGGVQLDWEAPQPHLTGVTSCLNHPDFTVSWSASDNLSGVASFDVQLRSGVDGTWIDWLSTSAVSAPHACDGLSYVRVRARDLFGNVSLYSQPQQTQYYLFLPGARNADGFTPVPTPTLTPTPAPIACVNVVQDSSFESGALGSGYENGLNGWVFPDTAYRAGFANGHAHSGSRSGRVGIDIPAQDRFSYSSLWQRMDVPSNASQVSISFYLSFFSTEPPHAVVQSPITLEVDLPNLAASSGTSYVYLFDADSGAVILPLIAPQWSNKNQWNLYSFTFKPAGSGEPRSGSDLNLLKGRHIKLWFGTFNDAGGGVTAMYVDDVSVRVCQ